MGFILWNRTKLLKREDYTMYQTNQYEGMLAETVTVTGHKSDVINAY